MITAGNRGYGAWRDGGFTIHDISDPREAEAALAHQLVAAVSRRHAHAAAAAGPQPRGRRRRGERREVRQGHVPHVRRRRARAGEPGADLDAADADGPRLLRAWARSARTTCTRTGPGRFRSEDTIFATYNNAGVRVFDIKDAFAPKEIASWVPPAPKQLIDPRPNVALAAKTADVYVTTDGLMYVSDWNAGLNVLQYQG